MRASRNQAEARGRARSADDFLPSRTACQAGEPCADLADDLGVTRASRDMRVFGLQVDRLVETRLHLTADP